LFSHDTEQWLGTVVDLVNSVGELEDLPSLDAFVRRHDISGVDGHVVEWRKLRQLRE